MRDHMDGLEIAAKIENAGPDDLPEILALQKKAYRSEAELTGDFSIQPMTQTLKQLEEEFCGSVILKAVDGTGRILGSVRWREESGTVFIGKLMVLPELQKRGLGKRLLRAVEGLYPGRVFELFTGSGSERNLAFYKKEGYTEFRRDRTSGGTELVYLRKPENTERRT